MKIEPGTIVEFAKSGLRMFKTMPLDHDEYVRVNVCGDKAIFLEAVYNGDKRYRMYFKLFYKKQLVYFVTSTQDDFLRCVKVIGEVEK